MTVKEYKIISTLKQQYKGDELTREVLRWLSKDNPSIKLNGATQRILEFHEILNNKPDGLIQKFKYNDVEYGLIPDFEDITVAEFLDLNNYENSVDDINKLLAVLYRPIKSSIGKYYEIEEYDGTGKRAILFENIDIKIYFSVVNFFSTLLQTLLKADLETSMAKGLKTIQRGRKV